MMQNGRITDIRVDLIFVGFKTAVAVPGHPDDHDLNLSSGHIQEIAPITALALDPEQAAPSKDGRINPTTEATDSMALEPQHFHTCMRSRAMFQRHSYAPKATPNPS